MTEPGGVETPGTLDYWRKQIAARTVDPDLPWRDEDVMVVIRDLVTAHHAERERIVRAVEGLPEASHQRVGPKGWRHVAKDVVLAILRDEP